MAVGLVLGAFDPPTARDIERAGKLVEAHGLSHAVLVPAAGDVLQPTHAALPWYSRCLLATLACGSRDSSASSVTAYVPDDPCGDPPTLEHLKRCADAARRLRPDCSFTLCGLPCLGPAGSEAIRWLGAGLGCATVLASPKQSGSLRDRHEGQLAPLPLLQSALARYGLYQNERGSRRGADSAAGGSPLSRLLGWHGPVIVDASATEAHTTGGDTAAAPLPLSFPPSHASSSPSPPLVSPARPRRIAILGGSFSPITLGHTQVANELLEAVPRPKKQPRTTDNRADGTIGAVAAPSTSPVQSLSSYSSASEVGATSPSHEAPASTTPAQRSSVEPRVSAQAFIDEVWLVPCGPRPDKPSLNVPPSHRHAMALLAVEAAFPAEPRVKVAPLEVWTPGALASHTLMAWLDVNVPKSVEYVLAIGADLYPGLARWRHAQALLRHTRFCVTPRPGYRDVHHTGHTSGDDDDDPSACHDDGGVEGQRATGANNICDHAASGRSLGGGCVGFQGGDAGGTGGTTGVVSRSVSSQPLPPHPVSASDSTPGHPGGPAALLTRPVHCVWLARRDGAPIETADVSSSQVRARVRAAREGRGDQVGEGEGRSDCACAGHGQADTACCVPPPSSSGDAPASARGSCATQGSPFQRDRAVLAAALDGLVAPPVAVYIADYGLYQ